MSIFTTYKKGLVWGMFFGTAGLFLLALFSLMSPVVESLSQPFLWPGRLFSSFLTDGTGASTSTVAILYVLTGVFYAVAGMLIQVIARAIRGDK